MFNFLKYFFINTLLIVFIHAYDIPLQSDSVAISNEFNDGQKNIDDIDFHDENDDGLYHTSKHVFYWLYTRDNTDGQLLNRSEPHLIESTTYNSSNPTKVIVHGWLGTTKEKDSLCMCNMNSYFKVGEYNVICVDWKQYATDLSYSVARARAKHIAHDIAKILKRITYNMTVGVETMHLIGHSMGAHIVGFVGKELPDQIPRITGLDPAKPQYENKGPNDRLYITDAHFVDIMHTNSAKNGFTKSIGHIDFFPNGGQRQPGCGSSDRATGSCSHIKAYHYYAHSIWAKEDYVAHKCSSWDDYTSNSCDGTNSTFMGEHVDIEQTENYYLRAEVED
ncbi:pancreatic lipase-related protein 2-like [Myzus persicae]|uniref:pancreatic lipase-related protein 2-like n=1 Tax=Myzus persicae TaxID=13164 RepID=UPI000B931585|nr:pancreatic lipase-related protein 2-like [Myzus persicae]